MRGAIKETEGCFVDVEEGQRPTPLFMCQGSLAALDAARSRGAAGWDNQSRGTLGTLHTARTLAFLRAEFLARILQGRNWKCNRRKCIQTHKSKRKKSVLA
jgi:hypothetical protein